MTPWVLRLLLANVVMFLLTQQNLPEVLALMPRLILHRPWTVFTYMFLHAGLTHLFFNMLGLFFFGPRLEVRLGGARFLALYFISGLGGALLSLLTPDAWIIGASGAVFGVFLGFAMFWPDENIYIWMVLPVRARVLVTVMTVLSLAGGFAGARDGVAHFAHLGGFVGGFLYLKWLERRSPARKFKQKTRQVKKSGVTGRSIELERWRSIRREGMHPINRDELDRILSKIERAGVTSLSSDERAFLERITPKPD